MGRYFGPFADAEGNASFRFQNRIAAIATDITKTTGRHENTGLSAAWIAATGDRKTFVKPGHCLVKIRRIGDFLICMPFAEHIAYFEYPHMSIGMNWPANWWT